MNPWETSRGIRGGTSLHISGKISKLFSYEIFETIPGRNPRMPEGMWIRSLSSGFLPRVFFYSYSLEDFHEDSSENLFMIFPENLHGFLLWFLQQFQGKYLQKFLQLFLKESLRYLEIVFEWLNCIPGGVLWEIPKGIPRKIYREIFDENLLEAPGDFSVEVNKGVSLGVNNIPVEILEEFLGRVPCCFFLYFGIHCKLLGIILK